MIVCGTNSVHEGETMWLTQYFMNKTASGVQIARFSAEGIGKSYCLWISSRARYFITYAVVVYFLLHKIAIVEFIA